MMELIAVMKILEEEFYQDIQLVIKTDWVSHRTRTYGMIRRMALLVQGLLQRLTIT